MINHHILADLAVERHGVLAAEAEADRRAHLATIRPRRPRPRGAAVSLRDGSTVVMRPVRRSDADLLAEGFAQLSPESRRFRFLAGKPTLSSVELRRLTDIDHHDHEAIGAVDPVDGRGLGVARFVRCAHDPAAAEVAVTVIDAWHGRGLGRELMRRLVIRATEEGIARFEALIAADNYAVLALLRSVGTDVRIAEHDGSTLELSMDLPGPARAAERRNRVAGAVRRWGVRRAVPE